MPRVVIHVSEANAGVVVVVVDDDDDDVVVCHGHKECGVMNIPFKTVYTQTQT